MEVPLNMSDGNAALNQSDSEQTESAVDQTTVVSALYERHVAAIFTYIYGLVDDWHLAHDLTQETFLQLYQTRERLRDVTNQRAWVYRIASHIALNERKRRRRFVWLPWNQVDDEVEFSWTMPGQLTLEEEISRRDAINCALAALAPHHRAPLLLYSVYGFRTAEIAEMLGISVVAVKQRLRRGREQFRQAYRAEEGDEDE